MTILGREAQLPADTGEWIRLLLILAAIGVAMTLAAGLPGATIALITACAGFLYDHNLYLPFAVAVGCVAGYLSGRRATDPHPARRAAFELGVVATGFGAYEYGRSLVESGADRAVRHAEHVVAFERQLGLLFEGSLQDRVLPNPRVVEWFNTFYSFGFLAMVLAVLFFLYATDDEVYAVYRTALGVSALLALTTIWLFPLAPPRLFPASGMVDTHMLAGRHRGFINEFAAMPSLHVGWMSLCGFALWLTSRSRLRWVLLPLPGVAMALTVMVTGNHYWVDGLVGVIYAVGTAAILAGYRGLYGARAMPEPAPAPWLPRLSTKSIGVALSLGALFVYLVIRQLFDPGFTDYWGYLTAQIAITIGLLIWFNEHFRAEGGLSWFTQFVVVLNAWADALGTAGHFYDRYIIYDKITHFLGGVMLTAAAADVIFAIQRRRGLDASPFRALALAVCFSVGLGAAWELYEFLGDRLLDTGRHAGAVDTAYDLVSDTVGALVSVVILWRWRASESPERARQEEPLTQST